MRRKIMAVKSLSLVETFLGLFMASGTAERFDEAFGPLVRKDCLDAVGSNLTAGR